MLDPNTKYINIPSQHEELYQQMESLLDQLENHELSFDEWIDKLHNTLEDYKSRRGFATIGEVQ